MTQDHEFSAVRKPSDAFVRQQHMDHPETLTLAKQVVGQAHTYLDEGKAKDYFKALSMAIDHFGIPDYPGSCY
jgi:hypothetical protein